MKPGPVLATIALCAFAAPAHAERSLDEINATIVRHAPKLRACYVALVEGEGADRPSGKVIVKLTIRADGATERVRIGKRSTLRHEKLEPCVLKIFREMKFRPDGDDAAAITYPLVFQSE